jgi:signal transduction histidine kinase
MPRPLTRLSAAGLLRGALLAAAGGALLISESSRAVWLRPVEAALSLAILAAVWLRRERRDPVLLTAFSALFLGDSLYLVNNSLRILPSVLFPAEEGAYTVYIAAIAWYLIRACRRGTLFTRAETATLVLLFAGFAALSAKYVLFPFFSSGNFASPFFYITSTAYRAMEAVVVALAVLLGMKARSRYWFYTLNGLALLSISSLALGYNTGVLNEARLAFPFQEYGWLWGQLCLLAAQTYPPGGEVFARWHSARVRLAWFIFVFNIALLALLYLLRVLVSSNAFQLASLLLAVFGLWLVANLIAFRISEGIYLLLDNLRGEDPAAGKTAFRLNIYEAELFAEKLKAAYDTIKSQSQLAALAALSAQVAHDIRSPLAALDSALKDVSQLPEAKRLLIRGAAGRIRDIANNLLEKNRQSRLSAGQRAGRPLEPLLLSSLIEPVITEKRLQYRDRLDVSIEAVASPESYGLFARVDPVDFSRVLSNLINNSVEALRRGGAVTAQLTLKAGAAALTIRDDGKGIAPETLARLGRRGETHGKAEGSGLGLYHARAAAAAWGGSLAISSEPGKGTAVELILPLAEPPGWFVPALEFRPGTRVVILDDDTSIHQVWKGRFDSSRLGERGIQTYSFSSPDALRRWFAENGAGGPTICLFDYELLGHSETGLSLAVELDVAQGAILVTSRYDEPHVLEACLQRGIRLLPKALAGLVPIAVSEGVPPPNYRLAALLDDDELTLLTWRTAARVAKVELRAYRQPRDLLAAAEFLPRTVPLYIDSELGADVSGEEIAAALHGKGFTDITLATGHPPERFAAHRWLKVRGKEPPW